MLPFDRPAQNSGGDSFQASDSAAVSGNCDYCRQIASLTGRYHCPIHLESESPYYSRLDAERCTAEQRTKNPRPADSGKEPIEDSPLFGGPRQGSLL